MSAYLRNLLQASSIVDINDHPQDMNNLNHNMLNLVS